MVEFKVTPQTAVVLSELAAAARSGTELYGGELQRRTRLVSGTIHPILERLLKAGVVTDRWEERGPTGPVGATGGGRAPRRYYRLADGQLPLVREMLRNAAEFARERAHSAPVLVVESVAYPKVEDGGAALILEVSNDSVDVGEFVRLQSWYADNSHPVLKQLEGRRLRVTVALADEGEPVIGEWQARYEHHVRTHGCQCDAPNDGLAVKNCPRHLTPHEGLRSDDVDKLLAEFRARAAETSEEAQVFAWTKAAELLDEMYRKAVFPAGR